MHHLIIMGELRVRGDSSISHSSNGNCNGSNGYKNGTSHSSSGKNGERKARRRQRVQAKKRNKARRLILGMYVAACFVAGFLCINLIRGSTLKSTSAPQHGSPAASTGSASNGSGEGGVGAVNDGQNNNDSGDAINRILSEIPGNTPLTETLEQGILQAARGELNQFPNSIGTDENASNPTWETIEHPGDEALKVFNGHGPMHKKRKTAKELASMLSGKQLRGGEPQNNGEKDSKESSSNTINGIEDGYMRVPKLWDPLPYQTIADEREKRNAVGSKDLPRDGVRRYLGNFGSRLMTPAEAKSIGSRVPDRNDSGNMLETIFVAIASYRDWQCSGTVESALMRAAHPERIRIAVVDQIRIGDDSPCSIPPGGPCEQYPDQATCKYQHQVDYFIVDAELSVGPVFARHLGHRLYRGEYFAMQSDAHVSFVVDWDNEIVAQWHSARNEMAVLSTYLSGIEGHIDSKTGQRTSKSRPIMCLSDFEGHGGFKHLRHGQQPEGVPSIHEPTLDPFWAAGFSFARGHFVVNIPYDQHLPWVFQGEEISIGLRGFS